MVLILNKRTIQQMLAVSIYFLTTFIPFLFVSRIIADYIGIPADVALFGVVLIILMTLYVFIISVRNII